MVIVAEEVSCALDAGLFVEHIFCAARVHALSGSPRGKGTCLAEHHPQDIVQFHLWTLGVGAGEGDCEFEVAAGVVVQPGGAADVI